MWNICILKVRGRWIMYYFELIMKLIDSFMKLLGIGLKLVVWLVFYVLDMKEDDVLDFVKVFVDVKWNLSFCFVCGYIIDKDLCYICVDMLCDWSVICVV